MKEKHTHTLDVSPNNRGTQKSVLSRHGHWGLLCTPMIVLIQVVLEKFVLSRLWEMLCGLTDLPPAFRVCVSVSVSAANQQVSWRERGRRRGAGEDKEGGFKSKVS